MKILVDGDAIVYVAASQADGRTYICEDGSDFKYKKDAVDYCNNYGIDIGNIKLEYFPEPDSHACQNAKKLMERITETIFRAPELDGMLTNVNTIVCLKGNGKNFRNDIIEDYKANRADVRIPHHIPTVTKYLEGRYTCKYANDQEVDDVLGIEQYHYWVDDREEESIIVSHDKDLDMIPGWHLRIKRGGEHEVYHVDGIDADRNFYKQLLTGDKTDNIPGIKGIGPKKAEKLIDCLASTIDMYTTVEEEYKKDIEKKFGMTEEEYAVALDEMLEKKGRLLWIRRYTGQMWEAPTKAPF